jgi:hypothetical protein
MVDQLVQDVEPVVGVLVAADGCGRAHGTRNGD